MSNLKGKVFRSLKGRDKGKFLACLSDTEYLLADGKERPIGRPKKKNPLHLSETLMVLSENEMSTDKQLKRAIRDLTNAHGTKGES